MPLLRRRRTPAPDTPTPDAGTGSAASSLPPVDRHRPRERGIVLDCGTGPEVRHVGIVFVHGIGSQAAGETLHDWGNAIIDLLVDARIDNGTSADPVIDVQLDVGPGGSRFVEVELPAASPNGVDLPPQHWVMTEAWWAQRVQPPAFAQMADWLGAGGALQRILGALLNRAHGEHDPRLRPSEVTYPLRRGADGTVEEAAGRGRPEGMLLPPGLLPGRTPAAVGGMLYLQAISAMVLVLYGVLRAIEKLLPIGPLKDGALTRPLDQFLLDWFGDVYVLLSDPAQAASVRARLVDALRDLRAAPCDEVVIVAHSGGAIVSYMTLADVAPDSLPVDRLVTLGEGLNLAWQLTLGRHGQGAAAGAAQFDRLFCDVLGSRDKLRWDDFWASQDPAPVGVLRFPEETQADQVRLERVRSHSTWNRLSIGEDHGSYWDNDEEFLIPLLRLLEGRTDGNGLFGADADDEDRSRNRRRRLSILSLLRQSCLVLPLAGILAAFVSGHPILRDASDAAAAAWTWVPGTSWLSDMLNAVRDLHLEDVPAWRFLAEAGVWVVVLAIAASTGFSLLAPPERPLPWTGGRAARLVAVLLTAAPFLVGVPALIVLVGGALVFLAGSTSLALETGAKVVGVAVAAAVAIVARDWVTRRSKGAPWLQVVDGVFMVALTTLAAFLIAAPIVAAVMFVDVGRTVVGAVAIVLAFQVIARAGSWRWGVWDARERMMTRRGLTYRGRRTRVILQVVMLAIASGALMVGVAQELPAAFAVAAILVVALALIGVAIDVLDAVRDEQERPAASLYHLPSRGA